MSRHTTSFTTDPQYRARQELRNRLERIRDEAKVTGDAVGAFPGNEIETSMWVALHALCEGYIDGINTVNEMARQNKSEAASATRRVGHELPDANTEFIGREPA